MIALSRNLILCAVLVLFSHCASAAVINVGAGTITGLGAGSGAVIRHDIDGPKFATFIVQGDFYLNPGDTLTVINNPSNLMIDLVVGNNAYIAPGSVIDVSA